jgi:Ala-tRNA(Pro) deacylase
MNQEVRAAIRRLLHEAAIQFREIEHSAPHTSEESAKARGEELGVGATPLLLRMDGTFRLFVLPADRKLDSAAVKREFGVKQLRFATPKELLAETGLLPGSLPPFGRQG